MQSLLTTLGDSPGSSSDEHTEVAIGFVLCDYLNALLIDTSPTLCAQILLNFSLVFPTFFNRIDHSRNSGRNKGLVSRSHVEFMALPTHMHGLLHSVMIRRGRGLFYLTSFENSPRICDWVCRCLGFCLCLNY